LDLSDLVISAVLESKLLYLLIPEEEGADLHLLRYIFAFLQEYIRVIFIGSSNYLSDNLKIATYKGSYDEKTAKLLEKYEDYHILSRHGKPYFTLKVTNTNTLDDILNGNYYIKYQLSRANEMLYLDAKDVARENS
jgi:hypothetical protein